METLTIILVIAAILGTAVIAGVFLAFSSFVMQALTRRPAAEGIGAMQAINVTVINPVFLGTFLGTAAISIGTIVLAGKNWGDPAAPYYLGGAAFYLVGTILVTIARNVPMNDQLAALSTDDPAAGDAWDRYATRWTAWNHVRTAAAIIAALLYCLGLAQTGASYGSLHSQEADLAIAREGKHGLASISRWVSKAGC